MVSCSGRSCRWIFCPASRSRLIGCTILIPALLHFAVQKHTYAATIGLARTFVLQLLVDGSSQRLVSDNFSSLASCLHGHLPAPIARSLSCEIGAW